MKDKKPDLKFLLILPAIILVTLIGFFIFWQVSYAEKVYPGIKIGETDFSKKTKEESYLTIKSLVENIERNGFVFQNGEQQFLLKIGSDSFDSGPTYPFLVYSVEDTVNSLFDKSNNKNFLNFLNHLLFSNKKTINPVYELEDVYVKLFLKDSFSELIIKPENAHFSIQKNNELIVVPEKIGKDIDYDLVFSDLKKSINLFDNSTINIKTKSVYPDFKSDDIEKMRDEAKNILEKGTSFSLGFSESSEVDLKNLKWSIKPEELVTWIGVKNDNQKTSLFFDEEKIKTYLSEKISKEVDKEIVLPKFDMSGNKVSTWIVGQDGRYLNIEESSKEIINKFLKEEVDINLVVDFISVEDFAEENDFNIKEIIGTGHSSFKGSSANRRHNIKTGSNSLHGLLIKPGEEFSLIKNLGQIDGSGGYLTELVIKDGRTIPEYGGGLCQVGTTMFRTAIASGLPITMRRNHSYRVSYYEPAGTDATIYDPWPDFRFINDTGNYILIQYRMTGDDLYFDFWGIKDGRKVEITDPVIYNIVKPPATKIIETTDLAPGERKCTENAHNGADAYFDYTVTYPEGSTTTPLVKTRFSSHYVPWQAVCLVGKEKEVVAEIEISESSSEENINLIIE